VETFKSENSSSVPAPEHPPRSHERGIKPPLISKEESLFIGKNGGRYRGYVEGEASKEYKDSLAYRWAYFDPDQRKIVETYFAIEADDGENDAIGSPREAKGFNGMIVKLDSSGNEIGNPFLMDIYPECFADRKIGLARLRSIAHEVFEYTVKNAEENQEELIRGVRALLQTRGWLGSRSERVRFR
jgi:hypothetical protein